MENLLEMLKYRRPHAGPTERKFINRFIKPLGVQEDGYGNLYKIIGDTPRIMWSAHTDSVHRKEGKQKLCFIKDELFVLLSKEETLSNCLGADNAAGVWMLTEMIKAEIPGLYIFHRCEESSAKGSTYFAKNGLHLLDGIQAAIAFDRRNTHSVITHQLGGRCCSDAFGKSLADALGMGHELDDGGTFTDTASYMDIIPECTNVSAGYFHEHSKDEYLDVEYLLRLRDQMISADLSKLVIERDPKAVEEYETYSGRYAGYKPWYESTDAWDEYYSKSKKKRFSNVTPSYRSPRTVARNMADLVEDHPHLVAEFLEEVGVDFENLKRYIELAEPWHFEDEDDHKHAAE